MLENSRTSPRDGDRPLTTPESRRAFTLIELLVVIGILAVLISILLPALRAARESANRIVCLSMLRQMQLASQVYAGEARGWFIPVFPWFDKDAPSNPSWAENEDTRRALGIQPYKPVWYAQAWSDRLCPAASFARSLSNPDGSFNIRWSYGMNYTDFMDWRLPEIYLYHNTKPYHFPAYQASRIKRPSASMAMADALGPAIRAFNSYAYVGERSPAPNDQIAYRHQGGVNIVFFDGHAEWRRRDEVDTTNLPQSRIDELWYPYKPSMTAAFP